MELDFEIDKFTHSIENRITGDNFPRANALKKVDRQKMLSYQQFNFLIVDK